MQAGRALGQLGCPAPSSSELCSRKEPVLPCTPDCLPGNGRCASGDSPWYEAAEPHSHTLVGKQLLGMFMQRKALVKCILQELCPTVAMAEAACMPYTQHVGFPDGKLMGAALLRLP